MSDESGAGVSCIIPTHNRGEFLRDAIQSARLQTNPPVEIIVVSDVADSEAANICQSFADDGPPPVRYVERVDGPNGASGSRNHGARLANGDLLAFLDDDDLWKPRFLESCIGSMRSAGADLGVAWITEFSDQHQKPGHAIAPGLGGPDVLAVNPGITGSNFVVTRTGFERVEGFDVHLPVKNDTDFFARFRRAGGTYAVAAERLVLQRKHRLGQLTAVDERRARGTELYMAKHREHLSRSDKRELLQLVHRIRSRSSESRLARIYHLVWVAALYGPVGLVKKVIRGRERAAYEVGSSHDRH